MDRRTQRVPRPVLHCQAGDQVVDEIDGVVKALDEDAFAAAVGADIVLVREDAADAIGGNAGADHSRAVGGAGFNGRDDGESGPELVGAGGDGGDHLGVDGGVGRGGGLIHFGDGDFGIGQHLFERALDVLGFIDRQQAAVDGGGGELRESVLGVAGGEHGGHAGGAHLGVVQGDGGEARDGGGIVWDLHHALEVLAELATVEIGAAFESGAGDIEEVYGEIEPGEA